MRTLIPAPAPGIYRDVPMETYHQWDAVGNSHLGKLKLSPYHYRWTLDNGEDQTDAMKLGTAAHMAMLEHDAFVRTYAPHIEGSRATKAVKEDIARIEDMGMIALRPAEWYMIGQWTHNLDRHAAASDMMARATAVEISIVWEQDGILCKARPDLLCEDSAGRRICNDLKTSRSAHRAAFGKACSNYGYDRGAAHYLAGLAAVGLPCEDYVYTVFEKAPPYLVATYCLDEASATAGRDEWHALLQLLAECRAANEWPGYSQEIEPVSVPRWNAEIETDAEITIGGESAWT